MCLVSHRFRALVPILPLLVMLVLAAAVPQRSAAADDISDGRWTFTLRGGGQDNSSALGLDFRYDTIQRGVNLHLFGRYDALEDGRGIGRIDDQEYGAGVVFSRTVPDKANYYLGGSFLNEAGETFSQVYVGGKVKLSDRSLFSASYGFGLGDPKEVLRTPTLSYQAEAVDWFRMGGIWFPGGGQEVKLSYRLTDPGGKNIHGIAGEYSQVFRGSLVLGLRADVDVTENEGIERNWSSFLFLAFHPGAGRTRRVHLALNRDDIVSYPTILRTVRSVAPAAPPLVLTPPSATVVGYTGTVVLFTASGGVPPYTWSNGGDGGVLSVINATQAEWDEDYDFCDITGTATVTVTDSAGNSTTAIIDIPTEDC